MASLDPLAEAEDIIRELTTKMHFYASHWPAFQRAIEFLERLEAMREQGEVD